jgi:hypothetical protein
METQIGSCSSTEVGVCTQFMLYTIVSGSPRALLNSFGQISRENASRLDHREGIHRPTVCCTAGEHSFSVLSEEFKRELGSDLTVSIIPVLQSKIRIGAEFQNFFIALVSVDFVGKIYTPIYSGGIRYITKEQIADVEEVSGRGSTSINPTRIRMLGGHGWKELLKEGFDVIGSMLK